jgi:hypothetical protein
MIGLSLLSSVSKHNIIDGRQRQPNHNTTTYCAYWRKTTTTTQCRCLPSVNTICGRILIGLSLLSSVSKHNMWSHYDDNNDNAIIIRPHIVFTDRRQQRQLNHNTTTYCVYWRTTTTINPGLLLLSVSKKQYVIVLWLGLLLLSVSKNNMWSYYEWIYCCCRPSVYTICGRIMIELSFNNDNPIITRPHIVFTDGQQQ